MKRFVITAWLGLGFCSMVLGQGAWQNSGFITSPAQIPQAEISFDNQGTITLNMVTGNNPTAAGLSPLPFSTTGTLYYTNQTSAVMTCVPGFTFETRTGAKVQNARSVVNDGIITGYDYPESVDTFGGVAIPRFSVPVASQITIWATNVVNNNGTISVGNYGILNITGSNVNLANGTLIAGALNTGGSPGTTAVNDPLDTTGVPGQTNGSFYSGGTFFVSPPNVYDLLWSTTLHNTTVNVQDLAASLTAPWFGASTPPMDDVQSRAGNPIYLGVSLPFTTRIPEFATYVYTYSGVQNNVPTTWYNIVLVNTNFADVNGQANTNINVDVGWGGWDLLSSEVSDEGGLTAMVQFSINVPDVVTGQTVTNAVYLLDVGAALQMLNYTNAGTADTYQRPSCIAITTTTPVGFPTWLNREHANATYTPDLLFPGVGGNYEDTNVTFEASLYGVQIGRNTGKVDGRFGFKLGFGSQTDVLLPDPTNESAIINVTANQLNLANAFLRSEGIIDISATNLSGQATGRDWGQVNAQLDADSGVLVVSNLFLTNFQRLRGNIYAWCGGWTNTYTNSFETNSYHMHLLVVDQDLGGNFKSAIRNLNLSGASSINVQDPIYVINQAKFHTASLTFNSNTVFTQNAGNLTSTNMPSLVEFLNNSNANLFVDNLLVIGNNTTTLPSVMNASYTVAGITNLGAITAGTPFFQSEYFENDGSITATNFNASLEIGASAIGLGLVLTNANNALLANGSVKLSALAIELTNSQIIAGGIHATNPGYLELDTAPNGLITDFQSGAPSTNPYSTNLWQVTDGFFLPIKPEFGDLYGTQITTITTGNTVANHEWAGVDWGTNAAGFVNNMVIGHLKLSRQSVNSILHFYGAGLQNAMYVDYLDLDPNSYSYTDYSDTNALIIDPNLTIYFAASDVDPIKLETKFPGRLVWVTNFAGPNSTTPVPYFYPGEATPNYTNTNVCLMNASLAESVDPQFAFWPPTPNAFNPNAPYILSEPGDETVSAPCPSNIATSVVWPTNFSVGSATSANPLGTTFATNYLIPGTDAFVDLVVNGQGSISPQLSQAQISIGRRYTLTATPAAGWQFAGWTVFGLNGVNVNSRVLSFTLQGGVTNIANFTPIGFTLVAGTYHGLFMPTNPPTTANSGAFTLTLGVNGVFSGRLMMGPAAYTFTSQLNNTGSAMFNARDGALIMPVSLQFDMSGESGQVSGYVGNANTILSGDVAPTATFYNPTPMANFNGRYTLVMTNCGTNSFTNMVTIQNIGGVPTPVTNNVTNSYGSLTSYGTLSLVQGAVTVAGGLADGWPFSQSVPISRNGRWPFYAYVPGGGDYLLGWISFQTNIGKTIVPTNVFWDKAALGNHYYPAGFTNTITLNLFGSFYADEDVAGAILPPSGLNLPSPVVTLAGGGLAAGNGQVIYPVNYNGGLLYYNNNLTLYINPVTGTFSGQLVNSGGIQFSGVVLQGPNNAAYGYFLNPNSPGSGSGSVLLDGGP